MKFFIFLFLLISLFSTSVFQVHAQSLSATEPTQTVFDMSGFPQWAKDLRRWEIITFGTFPFSMFVVTFFTDMVRWGSANGMDFSTEGRRYAPWPLKSAGAVEMTGEEFRTTVLIAAGLSMTLAFVDYYIVSRKRNNERVYLENNPPQSVIIERTPADNNSGGDGSTDTHIAN